MQLKIHSFNDGPALTKATKVQGEHLGFIQHNPAGPASAVIMNSFAKSNVCAGQTWPPSQSLRPLLRTHTCYSQVAGLCNSSKRPREGARGERGFLRCALTSSSCACVSLLRDAAPRPSLQGEQRARQRRAGHVRRRSTHWTSFSSVL